MNPLTHYAQFIEEYSPVFFGIGIAFLAILFIAFCIWLSHNTDTKYNPIHKGRPHVRFDDVFAHIVIYPLFGVFVISLVIAILYIMQNGLNMHIV
ncbi:hypothetical protein H6758_03490 [Candidatus Nomurabacteria bacterium]|nr:hypothetical protein [Candidatus Nomurabacteria bacterium]